MPICPLDIRDLVVDLEHAAIARSGRNHSFQERLRGLEPNGKLAQFIKRLQRIPDPVTTRAVVDAVDSAALALCAYCVLFGMDSSPHGVQGRA